MTLRARPTTRKPQRTSRDTDSRRNLYMNIGFGLVVAFAVVVLLGAALATWFDDHLAAVATVNGESITKDQLRTRIKIESFRLDRAEALVRDEMNLGHISSAAAQQYLSDIAQRKQAVSQSALSAEEDTVLLAQLARQRNVTATDAQIDAKLTTEATTDEQRHAWVISVIPEVSTGASAATQAQKDAAKAKAQGLLSDLKGGKAWEEVVKSSGDSYAATNGDLNFIGKTATTPDAKFVAAIFALSGNGLTDVVEGDDGTYRIGRVTEIVPQKVDPNYSTAIADAGIDLKDYRRVVATSVLKDNIEAQLFAEVIDKASTQRKVQEVVINGGSGTGGNEANVRHILYSPKDDPQGAAQLAASDPAWTAAQNEANAAYEKLKSGQADFADLAKTQSDDKSSGANGGDLGWLTQDSVVAEFGNAVFGANVKPGDLLPPVKSSYGWHVIQVMGMRAAPDVRAQQVVDAARKPGADFGAIAKANSDGPTASTGGDVGWVARYQLDQATETAIFALQAGAVSDVVTTTTTDPSTQQPVPVYHVYKVTEVADRMPDQSQVDTIRADAFNNWYSGIRDDTEQTKIEELLPDFTG